MLLDKISITGHVKIEVIGPDGNIKDFREIKNLVVTTGKEYIAARMKDATVAAMSYMELGTGTTAAAAGDTALQSAISGSRTAISSITVATNTIAYAVTFPAGTGTGAVTEAGIFNAASAGTMLCRSVFAVVNKGAADGMSITWTITVS